MIGFLKGTIDSIYEDRIMIDVNGIGFNVYMPAAQRDMLYGFTTADSLDLFKMLIQVNGIGPKGALALLSAMSTDDLKFAIMSGDAKTISKAPGIGAKTAQRLIIDLKDKVSVRDMLDNYSVNRTVEDTSEMSTARAEAIEALTALGYSSADALKAVKMCGADENADTETIIKLAFRQIVR